MSIANSAMLVELNISVWGATKLDRSASDELTSNKGASNNAAQVRKNLMAGSGLRKEISDYASKCRLFNNQQTLAWSDKGVRLLPTKNFMFYKQNLNVMEAHFNQLVSNFIQHYPTLIQQAQANLNTLFNAEDYPTVEEVTEKFGFKYVFTPVPTAGDFRIDVTADEVAELSRQYEASFNDRLNDAMKDQWDRLHGVLTHISERLTETEGEEKGKRMHESMITNAQSLCELLTKLNVTNDPKLEEARRALELTLLGVDKDSLKESPALRESVKTKVDDILKRFDW